MAPSAEHPAEPKRVDIAGTIRVIAAVSGLFALIFFACFNNFLGGIFMALLDAYGLSLISLEAWKLGAWKLGACCIASRRTVHGLDHERHHHCPRWAGQKPTAHAADGQSHHLVGLLCFHAPAVHLTASLWLFRLDVAVALCRGGRTYDATKGGAAGPTEARVRLCPIGGAIRLARNDVPDRTTHSVRGDPVHDRRAGV